MSLLLFSTLLRYTAAYPVLGSGTSAEKLLTSAVRFFEMSERQARRR
jgi:hypothetical protein